MLKLQSILKATVCLAAVALAAMGCSQDEWAGQSVQKGNTTIIASFEGGGADTRTSVETSGGNNEVVWNKDDAFGLFYTKEGISGVEQFKCPDADGSSTSAKFIGTLDADVTTSYAVYPYQKDMGLKDNTISMTLPATFDYTEASNGPMYADAKDIKVGLQFKHLAGLLKLTVSKGIQSEALKFVITADKPIAGTCTADLSTDPAPFLTPADNGSKTITVNLSFGVEKNTPTIFYIPIPVGEYATLSAQILGAEDKPLTSAKEWENVTVQRAQMLTADFGFITFDASTGNLDDAIKNELPQTAPSDPVTTDLAISGTIDAGATSSISIPVLQNSNVNLTLMEIPTTTATTPLELKDATSGTAPAEAVNTVTVAIPKADESTAPSLTITMPQTTVVLDAMASEGTTYNVVTATTASNTLVIEKGVKVNKLIVKGGNVRVKGEIGSIEKEGELSTTTVYIIKETGAVLPNGIPEGFVVADPAAYDMQMAFAKGGEYVLTADASIIGAHITVPADKTVTLNLNGHIITAANKDGDNIVVNGKMTLKDTMQGTGKIVASEDYVKNVYSTTLIYISGEEASFTMTGGTIEAVRPNDPVNNGQFGVGVYDGGDFTMTDGKIEAGWYAVAGNGNYKTQNSIINIKGGELISTADYAVYLPQAGTTTISGGKINGAAGGIAMQNGTLNISGNAQILSTDEGNTGNWSDGTGGLGNAALVINAGYGDCVVNITGGTISALKKAALIDTPNTKYERTIKISGGTFSDPSALAYLTAEADVDVILNRNLEITQPIVVEPSKSVLLDLNGYSITPKGDLQKVKVPEELVTTDAMVLVRRGADLTIKDTSNDKSGSIDATGVNSIMCGVKLTDTKDESGPNASNPAKLTVNGGTIKGYNYGISGNGTRHDTEITINGGTIESISTNEGEEGTGIYHPQYGTLTVTSGTIKGFGSGIEIRSGKLTVEGGTISSTADKFVEKANSNGTTIIGAAVAVSQHVTNKELNVATISGGTLSGPYALYEKDLQDEEVSNIAMTVTGGTLDGKVFSQNCKNFIGSGTFSDPNILQNYLTENANVNIKLAANQTCNGFITRDGQTVDINLNSKTLMFTELTVGSSGTETNNCQLLKGSKVTFRNGTLQSENTEIMIQNYCQLLLQDVTVIAENAKYVVSNNNGSCTINNSTLTAGSGKCAFDVYSFSSYEGVEVTVNEGSTINGKVEFGGDNGRKSGKLTINGGTFNGDLIVDKNYYNSSEPNIIINGGDFGEHKGWSDYKNGAQ